MRGVCILTDIEDPWSYSESMAILRSPMVFSSFSNAERKGKNACLEVISITCLLEGGEDDRFSGMFPEL